MGPIHTKRSALSPHLFCLTQRPYLSPFLIRAIGPILEQYLNQSLRTARISIMDHHGTADKRQARVQTSDMFVLNEILNLIRIEQAFDKRQLALILRFQ